MTHKEQGGSIYILLAAPQTTLCTHFHSSERYDISIPPVRTHKKDDTRNRLDSRRFDLEVDETRLAGQSIQYAKERQRHSVKLKRQTERAQQNTQGTSSANATFVINLLLFN